MEILLNPGPVNISERVRKAMLKPDLCHREIEFAALQSGIREKLLDVYGLSPDDWATILLTGSGTAAMEAMLSSLVPTDGKVLIIENGVYGERLTQIAEIYHIDHMTLHYDWGEQIRINECDLSLYEDISHVAVVHHETTTGRLNDISPIAELCREHNKTLLVDGVSSFGAEDLKFADWNITACAATANKCLHGVPGTSFVIVRRDTLEQTGNVQRSLYLDLSTYLAQQDAGGTPFTQSVQTFYALNEALDEHKEQGGWQARGEQYQNKMNIVRDGLQELGIKPLFPDNQSSSVLNAFYLPKAMSYEVLHAGLKQRGFVIYAGQSDFAKTLFRIAVMGVSTDADMRRFIAAVKETINTVL